MIQVVSGEDVASSNGVEPVIVWYGTVSMESSEDMDEVAPVLIFVWSDGSIEDVFRNRDSRGITQTAYLFIDPYAPKIHSSQWIGSSLSPQMAAYRHQLPERLNLVIFLQYSTTGVLKPLALM